ncbi:FAD-binding oxidoreductase [Pseudooceanicola aestuarii]|uniref:FAD-binding oxidoreductase n=1 Tax=Pseudooceanicola aestuarii TaxID=2697319 RepID=UPI0013D195EF|nr:FAD-binding oxidoreductase [Pseudooceanicola aestuarii]
MLEDLQAIVGAEHVLTGADAAPYGHGWGDPAHATVPLAVVRPASTEEVAAIVRLAGATGTALIPVAGRTGLTRAGHGEGALILSVERMNRIREIRAEGRSAVVEAGVILANLHSAVEDHDLVFPLTFGARGSAMVGGALGTNAGGSNVLRYGNTRDLVLGIEAVLPSGAVMNLMSPLHKDNSGYDLRHLLIGAEGTLGVITAAHVKLFPKPGAYATAMVAMDDLDDALALLNTLQAETGGSVEACEYMPGTYVQAHTALPPGHRAPFDRTWPVNILVEVGALAPRDCTPGPDGRIPVQSRLEEVLGRMLEDGRISDAVIASSEAQRREMWARREAAAEIAGQHKLRITLDVAVPLDRVAEFLRRADARLAQLDPAATTSVVAHLGDGNVHYTIFPRDADPVHKEHVMEEIEGIALDLGGTFSAEHGIGTVKLGAMTRRKDPAALAAMRAIKAALDPAGIMNPGKLIPPA